MVPARPRRAPLLRSTLLAFLLATGTVAVAVGRDAAPEAPSGAAAGVGISPVVVAALTTVPRVTEAEPAPRYDGRART